MAQRLRGKSAVVTGSGSGIGRAVALALATEGAKVVVNDIGRDPDGTSKADKVVEEITKANGTAVASYDSVTTMLGGENIIKTAISNFGRIDILVNCAGNAMRTPFVEMTEDEWDSVMEVHLKGHFACTKAAVREMVQQKSGRIINISSTGSFNFGPGPATAAIHSRRRTGNPAYGAAKAGILGFTAALSGELKEYGITVNAIFPSAYTPLFPEQRARFGGGDTGKPEHVAPIIAYLATDEAQKINGQFIYSCAGDICLFDQPLQLPGRVLTRKKGKWNIDELSEVIPPLLGLT
ncbi:MAG: SDR family NAD(P)-dependent oxidoreductase [Deltaproteobacteria bacterium]|nr:MAG: SDR family NAD(P)-dependent oxidoreductase [Deltaproteobacteria bacterium]